MKNKIEIKGKLKLYMQWPSIMVLLLVGLNAWMYRVDKNVAIVMSVFIGVYTLVALALYFSCKSHIFSDLVEFAAQYGVVQNTLLRDLAIPYAIMLDDGKIIWANNEFLNVLKDGNVQGSYLSKYIPDLNRSVFPEEQQSVEIEVKYGTASYVAELTKVSVKGFNESEQLFQLPKEAEYFVAIYLRDVTELNKYMRKHEDQKLLAGFVYVDNYDEMMESVEEVRQSLLLALIDRKINQYFGKVDAIIKKLEKDKYFVAVRKKHLQNLKEDTFSLLEDVKAINMGNTTPATLSIGLGTHGESYAYTSNYARMAINLALARGGDQAVLKSQEEIIYFGGKREQRAKNTRVKARVKAEAMKEMMMTKDTVVIMGHQLGDVDSLGAAIGLYKAATILEKKAYIVLNEITVSIRHLYEAYMENGNYPKNLFVTSKEVEELLDDNTMIIVVDTNKAELTECEKLLYLGKTLVVFDHHRTSSKPIENTTLSYIEPHASSTCEMVTEVLQYMDEEIKLTQLEASTLYAGIMVDTNNFMTRTGVRTFEAAAHLRRNGADIEYLRKMFRTDMGAYRVKAEIVSKAEMYHDAFAISGNSNMEQVESPTIVGAQVANELLNVENVKAAFVLTLYNGKIYVSARSIDEINVQIVMERLGGGGHMNSAGTQFHYGEMSKAIQEVKTCLDKLIEKGEITI
jgi:Predicted signaling protein consisting of a modified GGDEF domain and a DHH domain